MYENGNLKIEKAAPHDVPVILSLIKELADYEKMLDLVTATERTINEALFGENSCAESLIARYENEVVGYAIFYHTFSSFRAARGLFLEDLYVKPEMRGAGIGKALLSCLARFAVERDCAYMEWMVLDWNEPSIKFYKNLGAKVIDDCRAFRLKEDALLSLARC